MAVKQFVESKKFLKAKEWYCHDYSKYLPHIVEDKHNKKFLYCKLLKRTINKIPSEVKKHVEGKKFQRYSTALDHPLILSNYLLALDSSFSPISECLPGFHNFNSNSQVKG